MRVFVSKSAINEKFIKFWNKEHPDLPAIGEFRPQRELYDSVDTDLSYSKWAKKHNLRNFRLDFCLRDYKFGAEFDGSGPGHASAKGINRDRLKNNQNIKLGYTVLRYPVSELESSMDFVADDIYTTWELWFEIRSLILLR